MNNLKWSFVRFFSLFAALVSFVTLVSCSFESKLTSLIPEIDQKNVKGALGLGSVVYLSSKVSSQSVQSSCVDTQVHLKRLKQDGTIETKSLVSSTVREGNFILPLPEELQGKIIVDGQKVGFVIEVQGCGVPYYRPVTGYNNQLVSFGSTLLTLTQEFVDRGAKPILGMDTTEVEKAIENLKVGESSDLKATLDQLEQQPSLRRDFVAIAQIQPDLIKTVSPPVYQVTAPTNLQEGTQFVATVQVQHWNTSYPVAYEWYLGAKPIGTGPSLGYAPTKNQQGSHSLKVVIGVDNGSGHVDATKPTRTVISSVQIEDVFPATAPSISLVGNSVRNSNVLVLNINTGSNLENCDSFSKMALTESSIVPPILESEFNLTCDQSGVQSLPPHTLSAGEGVRTVALWVRDSSGNISPSASTVNVTLDQTAPTLSLVVPPSVAVGGSADVGFTATDALSSLVQLDLQVALDGVTFTDVGSLLNASSPFAWSVPAGGGSQSGLKMKLTATDVAGNTTFFTSAPFAIDADGPDLTQTLRSSGAVSNLNTVSFGGSCEGANVVQVTGADSSTTACTNGSWSYAVSAQNADGSYSYTFTQADALGNTSSVSASWVRDTVAPNITQVARVNGIRENVNTVTFGGACESGGTITVSGAESASLSCPAGSWTFATSSQSVDGTYSYQFSHTDVAGNEQNLIQSWIRDTTAPALTQSLFAGGATNTSSLNFGGDCEMGKHVAISGAETSTVTCAAGTWSFTAHQTTDGNYTYQFAQTDEAGNVKNISTTWVRDTVVPVFTQTLFADASRTKNNTITLGGSCETGLSVDISGTESATANCTAGSWSYTTPVKAVDQTYSYTVGQTDAAGNSTSINLSWIRDTTPPALVLTSPADGTSFQNQVQLVGTCEAGLLIQFAGAGILSPFNLNCVDGNFDQVVFLKNDGDGAKTISISQQDVATNVATVTRNFVRDNQSPIVTQLNVAFPVTTNGNSVTLGGACEAGLTVTIKKAGANLGTVNCPSSSWSYAVPTESVDGAYDYTVSQTDSAGNLGSTLARWIRDTTNPSLAISAGQNQITASSFVTISGSCETGLGDIVVTGSATGVATCSGGSWSYTTPSVSTDAVRNYSFKLTDAAGNFSVVTAQWERNTNVPNLTVATAQPLINKLNSASISGSCENGYNVEIRLGGVLEATTPCSSGSYVYNFSNQTTDGSRVYQVKQTNALSLSTTASFQWVRDTQAPVFTDASFKLNGNVAQTGSPRVQLSLSATDSLTRIMDLCLKVDITTTPISSDPCWTALDAASIGSTRAQSVAISNMGYNLPITPGVYKVYGWLRDEAGNISQLTNAGVGTALKDFDDITLYQPIAPIVHYVLVGSTDYPANPPSNTDLTVGTGAPVYVKWKVTDDAALPAQSISVYFSTDEITWTLIASNLVNGVNGTCEVNHPSTPADNDATGCYRVSANPSAGFVKYRVVAKDSDSLESGMSSMAMNISSTMRFLAGNTDPGLNLSAKSAMFFYRRMGTDPISVDTHTLVVTRDGVVYFKDAIRGILKVDPADGVVKSFLRQTGATSGDGGPVSAATGRYIHKITLDHNYPKQRLWLFDYDRIRRVDLETGIITTVIGGGSDESDTVVNPLNAKLRDVNWHDPEYWDSYLMFFAAPNGDFYFRAGNDGWADQGDNKPVNNKIRVRKLSAATGQISSWRVTSVASGRGLVAGDYGLCPMRALAFSYDKSNSQVVDRIGVLRRYPGYTGCTTSENTAYMLGFNNTGQTEPALHPQAVRVPENGWYHERVKTVTGLDGKIYAVAKDNSINGIWRYEGAPSYGWTRILGGGVSDFQMGSCEDGADALSCRSIAADVFVSENGTVYFVDDGLIRTINSAGKVVTLMGQRQVSGVGKSSLLARLGNSIRTYRLRNDGGVVFTDQAHQKFYEFDPNGNLYHLAGNGGIGAASEAIDARTTPVNIETPITSGDEFGLDPVSGDIYHHSGASAIKKLTRSSSVIGATGVWSTFLGYGTNHWASSAANGSSSIRWDGDCSVNVDPMLFTQPNCWFPPKVIGLFGGRLLLHNSTYSIRVDNGTDASQNNMIKLYDIITKVQTHLLGKAGYNTITNSSWEGLSPLGTALDGLEFWTAVYATISYPYYVGGNRWLFMRYANNGWKNVYDVTVGGTLQSLTTLSTGAKGFTYRLNAGTSYIYFCSTNGNLYRRNVNAGTETQLTFPIAGMTCESSALFYRDSSQSLIFAYKLNGLMGFGEYFDLM